MTQEEELKKIKKVYGEKFMKMCRSHFPIILEEEGRLLEILSSTFSNNGKTLYEDIQKNELEFEFKDIIYNKFHREESEENISVDKTPYELLDEAGYELIECKTEEEIQSFKKYYARNEELCTFGGGRLDRRVVFFAVKKDVENIKREKFENPEREDDYGTSVMSIQFDKKGLCIPHIICRYNHRIKENPDATFGDDLNKITPGLEKSFEKLLAERGLQFNNSNKDTLEMPGYVVAGDGKMYKYNTERNGIYYCPENIIIKDGEVNKLEKPEQQMLIDNFVLDTKNKTIEIYDPNIEDSFVDGLENINKIEVKKDKESRTKVITLQQGEKDNPITIEINESNQIIGYENANLTEIGDDFLYGGEELRRLEVPNVRKIGHNCLFSNEKLTKLEVPKVKKIGDCCLWYNKKLTSLEMPNAEEIGDAFATNNQILNELIAPKLKKVGHSCFEVNQCVTSLDLPNLEKVGEGFF